jgi:transcription-repair coupling factor (superfamily II helicase)
MRLCPPSYIAGRTFFSTRENSSIERLREQLAVASYERHQVVSPGEVCFRGGLIDLSRWGRRLTGSTSTTT